MTLNARRFQCGYCDAVTNPIVGWGGTVPRTSSLQPQPMDQVLIYICSGCERPTFFDPQHQQHPGPLLGRPVEHLPTGVDAVYREARNSAKATAYTGCVLLCRTLLSHVAMEHGAKANDTFKAHVQHLIGAGVLPPKAEKWVDSVRNVGNEVAHDLILASKEQAEQILSYVEMVLKLAFEFPGRLGTSETEKPAAK